MASHTLGVTNTASVDLDSYRTMYKLSLEISLALIFWIWKSVKFSCLIWNSPLMFFFCFFLFFSLLFSLTEAVYFNKESSCPLWTGLIMERLRFFLLFIYLNCSFVYNFTREISLNWFSLLSAIEFSWCRFGEFCIASTWNPLIDDFIYSQYFSASYCKEKFCLGHLRESKDKNPARRRFPVFKGVAHMIP